MYEANSLYMYEWEQPHPLETLTTDIPLKSTLWMCVCEFVYQRLSPGSNSRPHSNTVVKCFSLVKGESPSRSQSGHGCIPSAHPQAKLRLHFHVQCSASSTFVVQYPNGRSQSAWMWSVKICALSLSDWGRFSLEELIKSRLTVGESEPEADLTDCVLIILHDDSSFPLFQDLI